MRPSPRPRDGFSLVLLLLLLVALCAVAVILNRERTMDYRSAHLRQEAIQARFALLAASEEARAHLDRDTAWRTASTGEVFAYTGQSLVRRVSSLRLPGETNVARFEIWPYAASGTTTRISGTWSMGGCGPTLYIADTDNHCVRRVTPDGVVATVAGIGQLSGSTGNGGQAALALLSSPWGVAMKTNGVLFIVEQGNHWIRLISNGIIRAFAGTGSSGYSGDGGAATNARFSSPSDIAFDYRGNTYIADTGNDRVRRIDANGIIRRTAGNGDDEFGGDGGPATGASLNNPAGVACDTNNNVYIADTDNHCIRCVGTNGIIQTVAGRGDSRGFSGDGGPATSARLNGPLDVEVGPNGRLYIADTGNHCIRCVDLASGIIQTVAGTPPANGWQGEGSVATAAALKSPRGLAVDQGGDLFITDTGNARIKRVYRGDQLLWPVAWNWQSGFSGDGGDAMQARFRNASRICAMGGLSGTGAVRMLEGYY